MRASSAPLVSNLRMVWAVEGSAETDPASEPVANGLGAVVSSAVGSVLGAFTSETAPSVTALAPLAATLGDSATAGAMAFDGCLLPCGAVAGVYGSDFAGTGGLGLALKLDRHCTKSNPRMAASTNSRSTFRKPPPEGSSSSRYSAPS